LRNDKERNEWDAMGIKGETKGTRRRQKKGLGMVGSVLKYEGQSQREPSDRGVKYEILGRNKDKEERERVRGRTTEGTGGSERGLTLGGSPTHSPLQEMTKESINTLNLSRKHNGVRGQGRTRPTCQP